MRTAYIRAIQRRLGVAFQPMMARPADLRAAVWRFCWFLMLFDADLPGREALTGQGRDRQVLFDAPATVGRNREVRTIAAYTGREIAHWLLAWAEHNEAPMSNLKLQKLLDDVQSHCLGEHGVHLFDGETEAWAHRPVLSSVNHHLKHYGNGAIDVDAEAGDALGRLPRCRGPPHASLEHLRQVRSEGTA